MRQLPREIVVAVVLVGLIVASPLYEYIKFSLTGGISRKGDVTEVDLKAMSYFEMDQINGATNDIPQQFRNLNGARVRLEGEMWSPDSAAMKVRSFDLVYSIGQCCFAGPPKIQHFVKARVDPPTDVKYWSGVIKVTGILHVGVERSAAGIESVYRLDVERVDPL